MTGLPAALLLLLASCAIAGEPAPQPGAQPLTPSQGAPVALTETITETTVGDLGGESVPMGNMTRMDYTLPDGTTRHGLVCSLAIGGRVGVFVGLDSVVDVEGTRWQVTGIEKVPGQLGSVTLKRLAD